MIGTFGKLIFKMTPYDRTMEWLYLLDYVAKIANNSTRAIKTIMDIKSKRREEKKQENTITHIDGHTGLTARS